MHPALIPSALVFAGSLALAGYVVAYREKTDLHWLLLGTLLSLATWTLGGVLRYTIPDESALDASMRILLLGVFSLPPFWLGLAARYARIRIAERRAFSVALIAPSALAFVALLTNGAHRLVIREISFEALRAGGTAWAGPLFWVFVGWGWICGLGGALIYLTTAGRMVFAEERRRGLLLALASVLPILAGQVYLFQLLPIPFDLTPSALLVTVLIISTTVFRYRLLRAMPVARRDVIEHLEDGVVMASPSGVILDLNPASERVLGRGARRLRRHLLGHVLAELAPAEKQPALREAFSELTVRGEPISMELRTADDRRIALTADRTFDSSGSVAGIFAVLRDRTDERRFERLLRRTQRLQTAGTLAAGIAHEVNNPLSYIRANLGEIHRMGEIVERGVEEDSGKLAEELADLRQIAEETLDGIGRIEGIVDGMRRLSAETDAQARPRVALDLNAVVRDAVRLANLHRKQVVDVRLVLADDLPPLEGSPERLVQAMVNLLVNARHAVEKVHSPCISVVTERDGEDVEIRVSDNGPGVPDEIQERIFDPFFTTKGPDRGTGLGLSISYDIVREHGGELEVRSHPCGGAAFVARLPLAAAESSP